MRAAPPTAPKFHCPEGDEEHDIADDDGNPAELPLRSEIRRPVPKATIPTQYSGDLACSREEGLLCTRGLLAASRA